MSKFNWVFNSSDFYHTYNLDWLVSKMNELAEYVKEKVGLTQDTADELYIKKLRPYTDPTTETEVIPAPETQDIGANVARALNDGDCLTLRPYSPELTDENQRGTIGVGGSSSTTTSPVLKVRANNGNSVGVKVDGTAVKVTPSENVTVIDIRSEDGNGYPTLRGVASPVATYDAAPKSYVDTSCATVKSEVEAEIPDITDYVTRSYLTERLIQNNNNPSTQRGTVTGTSLLMKDEIIDLIEAYIDPAAEYLWTSYDQANEQYMGTTSTMDSTNCVYRVKIQDGTIAHNDTGHIGIAAGTFTNSNLFTLPHWMAFNGDATRGWGWTHYMNGLQVWTCEEMFASASSQFDGFTTDFALGSSTQPVLFHNMATPVSNNDGANKEYVDSGNTELRSVMAENHHETSTAINALKEKYDAEREVLLHDIAHLHKEIDDLRDLIKCKL